MAGNLKVALISLESKKNKTKSMACPWGLCVQASFSKTQLSKKAPLCYKMIQSGLFNTKDHGAVAMAIKGIGGSTSCPPPT